MDAYASMFLEYLGDVRGCSRSTVKSYESDLKIFFAIIRKKSEEVTKVDIQKFIVEQKNSGRSPRTINRRLDCLSTFYDYLFEELELEIRKPVRKKYKQKVKDKHASRSSRIHPDDASRMLAAVKHLDKVAYIAMMLMGKQGLRIGEVRRLAIQDLDFVNKKVMIRGSKGDDRAIPLSASVSEAIKDFIGYRTKGVVLVWSQKTMEGYRTNAGIWQKVTKWMEKFGIPGTPHSWRRMFGTQLYQKTRDIVKVQEMLGHKSIETTRNSYVEREEENEKDRLIFDDIF